LTVLTRIAKRGEDRWLRRAFREESLSINLVDSALDVSVEVGDPLGLILADSLRLAKPKYQGIINHFSSRYVNQHNDSVSLSEVIEVILTKRIEFSKN